MRLLFFFSLFFVSTGLCCCSVDKLQDEARMLAMEEESEKMTGVSGAGQVTRVEFSGNENAYTFNVTIASPDTGCGQYADWWEVIDLDGNLIYRRILTHSHVNEQPFSRSGGAVQISETTEVYVRVHMNNSGYGATVQKGSVAVGFTSTELDVDFAKELEEQAPLPDGCAF